MKDTLEGIGCAMVLVGLLTLLVYGCVYLRGTINEEAREDERIEQEERKAEQIKRRYYELQVRKLEAEMKEHQP